MLWFHFSWQEKCLFLRVARLEALTWQESCGVLTLGFWTGPTLYKHLVSSSVQTTPSTLVPQLRKWVSLGSPTQVARNNRTRLTPFSPPTSHKARDTLRTLNPSRGSPSGPWWHLMRCSYRKHARCLKQPCDDVILMASMTCNDVSGKTMKVFQNDSGSTFWEHSTLKPQIWS